MAEQPDYLKALLRGNDGKAKPTPPPESFGPKEPMNIAADVSAFEVLLGGMSEKAKRLLHRLLFEWSRGDENSFPHEVSVLTLAQWHAAARVPIETAKVLQQHHDKLEDSATRFVRAADTKLVEYQKVGKLITQFEAQIARLTHEGDEALKRLNQITGNFMQAEDRYRRAVKVSDLAFFVLTLLFVAVLAFVLGSLSWRYMFLRGYVH